MQKYFVTVKNVLVDLFTVKHICKYNLNENKANPYCIKIKSDDTVFTIEYDTIEERDSAFINLQKELLSIVNVSFNTNI